MKHFEYYNVSLEIKFSFSEIAFFPYWVMNSSIFNSSFFKVFGQTWLFFLCVVTEVCLVISVISLWPDTDFFKFLDQKMKHGAGPMA